MVLSRSGYWLRPQNRSPDRRQAGVIASALRFYLYTRVILGRQPRHAPRRLRNHRADRRRRDEYIGLPEAWDRSGTRISKEQPGRRMTKTCAVLAAVGLSVTVLIAQTPDARQALIARAKSLELNTPYVPPPGEPLEHYASGYAKIMCSAVFVTGLDPAFAAENVGYFTAPYAERARLGTPKIDREKRTVGVTMPNGTVRVAKQVGSQGCITLPIGRTDVFL